MTNEIAHKTAQQGEIILYQPDETVRLEVRLEDDTVWLTQAQMAELFQKDQSVIARHIGNVFREGELNESSNMQILHNTLSKYKPTKVYSLNVIISVGYRVKSKRGTQFRIWATAILREFLLRGYAVSQQLQLDIDRHNAQYSPIIMEHFNRAHDRFLLIDDEVYHIGASLKDLGKKWFAFTLMRDLTATELISRISSSATA